MFELEATKGKNDKNVRIALPLRLFSLKKQSDIIDTTLMSEIHKCSHLYWPSPAYHLPKS